MRRVMLLAIVGALGVGGIAYAAVNNTYVVNAKITPIKSGTKKSPRPIATTIGWTIGTSPAGQRPAVVKGYRATVSGVQENTTLFPGCSTSTLTSKSPSACPKRSKIGSGYLINQVGSSKSSSTTGNFTCRAEVSLFNGGNHDLVLYVYKGSQVNAQPAPCPVPNGHFAIPVSLTRIGGGLRQSFTVPASGMHPATGLDAALLKSTLTIPVHTTTVTRKVHGKKTKHKVGLFESTACPHNHERQVLVTFTPEKGAPRSATANARCS